MRKSAISQMVQEHIDFNDGDVKKGLRSFREQVSDVVEEKKDFNLKKVGLKPLFEAMVLDTDIYEGEIDVHSAQDVSEAMSAAGFPTVVGTLIHPVIIKEYEPRAEIVTDLVTEMESNKAVEDHVGFGAMDSFDLVRERMPYEEAQVGEKKVRVANYKFGRYISVSLEMVMFDQTGDALTIAASIGKKAAQHLHKFVVQKACSLACTATGEAADNSLVINGTARAMYADTHASWDIAANDNLQGTALAPDAVQTAETLLQGMVDDKGDLVLVEPKILLVPPALRVTALRILGSPNYYDATTHGTVNPFYNLYKILVSPFLGTATAWYLGDFAQQTILQWVYKLKTESLRNGTESAFKADTVAMFKASYFCGVGCSDYRFVAKGNA